ncbi:MAG: RluA family pseudouridine synthase [Actinomycetota bacterium]|nr:RluA family pseudouridine synthase [Actinomycetota bacterium]MDA2980390.1 RluA family pseudouridine synthase [Actinomycetota bacterium]MDA3002468.1 RluA family pseudouridine synthase [Actinomycetota bacterium]
MPETRTIAVPEGLGGERLDVVLSRLFGFSRAFAQGVIDEGGALLDGAAGGKSDRVRSGALLEVTFEPKKAPTIVPIIVDSMTILYDDDDVVVIDKPPGLAAHPAPSWDGPSVLGALAGAGYRISTSGPPERQGIVHRLDVGTSGVMAVAKSEVAYSRLKRAFKAREVQKTYHALVQGHPDPSTGTIDAPIGRHPSSSWKFAVVAGGRASITHYEAIESFASASLLRVSLETGRTHQIRVHMSAHRHPIVGDSLYGADPTIAERLGVSRQWLHASELEFTHPVSGKPVRVECDFPDDLNVALERLRA